MTLHELEIGDKFIAVNDKAKYPTKYIVKCSPMFNRGHGSSTRLCVNLSTHETVSKSCRLEIKPIGESKHKAKMNNAIKL